MQNIFIGGGGGASPSPWIGGYLLDTSVIPKGSILDVTSIVYSIRIDPTFPAVPFYRSINAQDEADNAASFNGGIQADDLYLDPEFSRFLVNVNRQTPFSISYTRRFHTVTYVGASDDPQQPPPASELDLSRHNGTSVLNRNLLAHGDLNFHLVVREDQVLDFIFQTDQGWGPKAEVEVEWVGRYIPKTVWEEVIRANQ